MLEWLIGWKAKLIAAGVVALAIGAALLKVFLAGKAARDAELARKQLEAMKEAKDVRNEVDSLGAADVDRRLSQWVRD